MKQEAETLSKTVPDNAVMSCQAYGTGSVQQSLPGAGGKRKKCVEGAARVIMQFELSLYNGLVTTILLKSEKCVHLETKIRFKMCQNCIN